MTPDGGLERRALLQAGFAATLALAAPLGAAAQPAAGGLDAATRTWLKLVGDLSGRTVMSITEGMVWGFLPQADDLTVETFARRLYGYRSLLSRTARVRPDGAISLTTQGWTFYTDAASGRIVDTLLNPYTGQTVSCPPLSGQPFTATFGAVDSAKAPPLDLGRRTIGGHAFVEVTRLSRFKPADTTWFKLEADMTTYHCHPADLDNAAASHTPSTWSHHLVAEWQTWMKRHGAPGHILFDGQGAVLRGAADLPESLYEAVGHYFPGTVAAVTAWQAGAR